MSHKHCSLFALENTLHATSATLLHCLGSSSHIKATCMICCTLWFSMCIDLQTTNAIIYLRDTTHTVQNIFETKYSICLILLVRCDCFKLVQSWCFSQQIAAFSQMRSHGTWSGGLLKQIGIYWLVTICTEKLQKYQSHFLESAQSEKKLQKIRGVQFAILQSRQFFWGAVNRMCIAVYTRSFPSSMHFQKYCTVNCVHGT